MEVDISLVFSSLVGLFMIMGVGIVAVKARIIPASVTKQLSNILIQITLPCTVFYSLITKDYDPDFLGDSLLCMGLCLLIIVGGAACAFLMAKYLLRVRDGGQGVWAMACTFCNNGFIGYPIIQSLFGTDGLALAVMYGLVINVLTYSLGIWLITRDVESGDQGPRPKTGLRTMLFSNVNIALFIGMIFYFCRIPFPQTLTLPVMHLANMTTPLSMFTTGAIMASSTIGDLFKDKDVYKAVFVRLLFYPLLLMLILKHLPIANPLVYYVIAVTMMMPSPAISTILSDLYHGNRNLASKIVLASSVCCVVTIPLLTTLL